MKKKYELTSEFIEVSGKKLYRIKALVSFGVVNKGDLGGYVESEDNLSQLSDAWVFDDAMVFDEAQVFDDAWVFGKARIFNEAQVFGKVRLFVDIR
jgi:hypothetical protein